MSAIDKLKETCSLVQSRFKFRSTLEHTIQNWLKARTSETELPATETAQLISAIVRRLSRVSFITVLLALIPVGFLTWQNVLTQKQIAETQEQMVEQVRNQRLSETRRFLKEAEERMYRTAIGYFNNKEAILQLDPSDDFFEKCKSENSAEQDMISRLHRDALHYVRYLSELYLVDIRALNPLSGELSEEPVSYRGNAESWQLNQLASSAAPIMAIIGRCDPDSYALTRLVDWAQFVDVGAFKKFAKPAAEIKLKYDGARQKLRIIDDSIRMMNKKSRLGEAISVAVPILNDTGYQFTNVLVGCAVEIDRQDIAKGEKSIDKLELGTHEIQVTLASSETIDLKKEARISCRVVRAFANIDILR